jgi:Xaa-Pro aminopeptidase
MKASIQAAAEGHMEMMKRCKPGMRESQLACYLRELALVKYNIKVEAYPDIIGSGKNSGILHYEKNSKIIQDGDLVLCDCGHRVHGYCSDLTTTFPANGKFTPKQK